MPDTGDPRDRGLHQIFMIAAQVRRAEIINQLASAHGLAVMTGPFGGMTLLPEVCWNDGDLPPKILGCYEAELHPAVAKAIARKPSAVVNIGCAEGYYAVGMARALPQARVFAFESDARGQSICARAASANNVGGRVSVQGTCGPDTLRQLLPQIERPLLIVDCEGAELQLLDPSQVSDIKRCDVIVECHDFMNPQITAALRSGLPRATRSRTSSKGRAIRTYLRPCGAGNRWSAGWPSTRTAR
jgi:hypothetical protein